MGGQTMILNTNSTNVQYMFDRQKTLLELHGAEGHSTIKNIKNSGAL
jgi:hypothetical protein